MKIFKKITTLLMLALALVIVIPVNVLAETLTTNSTGKATVTIAGIDANYDDGLTVGIYKIIDTNIEAGTPKSPVYTWNAAIAPWVVSKHPEFIDTANHNAVKPAFAGDVAAFYDELAGAIGAKDALINGGALLSPVVTADKNNENAEGDVEVELAMGNYLVLVKGGVNIYKPSAINIVPDASTGEWKVNDTTITLKKETPSINKTVDGTTASNDGIGNEVDFEIRVTIPDYPTNANYKTVKVRDKFSAGLTYKKGSIAVQVVDASGNTSNIAASAYTLDEPETVTDYDFLITFDTDDFEASLEGNKTLIVTYKGIVNANAVVETAEVNKAVLEYSNDPYISDEHTNEDDSVVKVYTYGIELTKVDEKITTKTLPGAKFKVYADADKTTLIKFVGSNGVYRKAIESPIYANNGTTVLIPADTTTTDEVVTGSDGTFKLSGLAEGTYYLEETGAPDGYVFVEKTATVTITAQTANGVKTALVDDDGFANVTVTNGTDVPVLPITGGVGTIIFSIIGILLMGLGVFFVRNTKKEN